MKPLVVLTLVALLIAFSCKKKDDPPPTGPTETPPENVIGNVTDLSGNPLANVQMHIVYSVNAAPVSPLDDQQNPAIAVFYTEQMLTTECGGDVPLADGTNIIVMWDADDNGVPSVGDHPPTACPNPPDCPHLSVNFNQFALNGVALELGPGRFGTDPAFSTYGDNLDPPRVYLEIRCTDGDVLWQSQVVTLPDGLSDQPLTMECFPCEGAPAGETSLGFAYPNPAQDDVSIPFTLRANDSVTIAARSLSTNAARTLMQETFEQGAHDRTLDISALPNGLYVYTMTSGIFTGRDTLLKNVNQDNDLLGTPALTTTDGNGDFALNAPFGPTITLRESNSNPLGESAPLDSVRIVALLNGYQPSDTVISLSAAEQHEINLRLQPQ